MHTLRTLNFTISCCFTSIFFVCRVYFLHLLASFYLLYIIFSYFSPLSFFSTFHIYFTFYETYILRNIFMIKLYPRIIIEIINAIASHLYEPREIIVINARSC